MGIAILFQVLALFFTKSQDWFVQFDYENPCYTGTTAEGLFNNSGLLEMDKCDPADDPVASFENYSIFSVSQFQYIILAITFSKGSPYRKNIFHNIPLIVDICLLSAFSTYLVLFPHSVFINGFIIGFELFLPPDQNFRFVLIGLVLANGLLCLFCECVISDGFVKKIVQKKNTTYDILDRELQNKDDWPPLSETTEDSLTPPADASPVKNDVVVTGKGVSDPNDAFDSLFSTPASISHSSAAVFLNPPPYSPKRGT